MNEKKRLPIHFAPAISSYDQMHTCNLLVYFFNASVHLLAADFDLSAYNDNKNDSDNGNTNNDNSQRWCCYFNCHLGMCVLGTTGSQETNSRKSAWHDRLVWQKPRWCVLVGQWLMDLSAWIVYACLWAPEVLFVCVFFVRLSTVSVVHFPRFVTKFMVMHLFCYGYLPAS